MIRRLGLGRVLVFLVAVAIVTLVVGLLITRNDGDNECATTTVENAPDTELTNSEVFAIFIAQQEEGPLPLDGWSVASEKGDTSVYRSDRNGHWQVTVARGAVRNYGCVP